jgi:hypothetical protein
MERKGDEDRKKIMEVGGRDSNELVVVVVVMMI